MPDKSPSGRPLEGISVLLACSEKKISALTDGLRACGAEVIPFPVIEIRAIEDKSLLDKALAELDRYEWILFTSAYGVRYFFLRFDRNAIRTDILKRAKICAIGPATAGALREHGHEAALIPEKFVAEGVLEALEAFHGGLSRLSGRRILIPRALEARDLLPDTLKAAGARVDVVPCYRTVLADPDPETLRNLRAAPPNLIVFTSSSTVKNTLEILGHSEGKGLLEKSTVAVMGPITAGTVESFGKFAEIIPQESTVASLIRAIEEYYSRH